MAKQTTPPAAGAATAPVAPSREFPKVLYHLKKGAKKVIDAVDEAAHKAHGYTAAPPQAEKESDQE